jgi:hypothetical protein
VAWSGLSVHGQVASIVIESGIRMGPYIFGRLLHAILAAILTVLLMGPAREVTKLLAVPVIMVPGSVNQLTLWITRLEQVGYQIALFSAILLSMSLIFHLVKGIRLALKK